MRNLLFAAIVASVPLVRAHIGFYDPSMWGFNVSMQTFPYDNRPMAPLQQYTFEQWWFHGHLGYAPNPGDFFELPAGGNAVSQLACNKGATKWWATSEGSTDIRQGEYPCPGYPTSQFHTNGLDDVKGCALSIAYTSDVNSIQPADLVIFSVNHVCVWDVSTVFQIPQDMPPCPAGGCICAWHWIHSADSGSAQMFMNGFRCQVTGSTSNNALLKPEVPKRCTNNPSACNQGAQQPLYWFQAEGNNMDNTQYDPPFYQDEWGFFDGAQNHIFSNVGVNNLQSSSSSSSSSSSTSSSSTPVNTPASTPANSQPSSSPSPSSSSNSNNMPQANDPNVNGGINPSNPTPSSSSSSSSVPSQPSYTPPANYNAPAPSPSPTDNGNNDGSEMDPNNTQPPSSSGTTLCRNRNQKKRQVVASRHFRNKRNFAREHHH